MDLKIFDNISPWIVIPCIFFAWGIVLSIVKKTVFVIVRNLASKTKTDFDDLLFDALDFPVQLLIYASGVLVVQSFMEKLDPVVQQYAVNGFKVVVVIAIALFADKFLTGLIKTNQTRVEILRTSSGIVTGLVRAVVFALGLLIVLDNMGVSVTPIIASLGIGSLAVALALQPTLENFFSGIQLVTDKLVQVGQFVKLESGEEGYVEKVGWRSTWVRMLPNNMVIVPNKVLVNSRVTNYYYPQQELAVLVQMGVHYGSDLEKVEKVVIEVGRDVMKTVQGGIPDFEPFIRYHTFADSSVNFSVILRGREFVDNYMIKHEFIKRVHKRFAREGICIPFPIRAINYDQEKQFGEEASEVSSGKK